MVYSCEVISLAQRHDFEARLGFTTTSPIAATAVTVSVPFVDGGNWEFCGIPDVHLNFVQSNRAPHRGYSLLAVNRQTTQRPQAGPKVNSASEVMIAYEGLKNNDERHD